MSFEERFPSLKTELASYPNMDKENVLWIEQKYVENFCFDRSWVIQQIKETKLGCDNEEIIKEIIIKRLKK